MWTKMYDAIHCLLMTTDRRYVFDLKYAPRRLGGRRGKDRDLVFGRHHFERLSVVKSQVLGSNDIR